MDGPFMRGAGEDFCVRISGVSAAKVTVANEIAASDKVRIVQAKERLFIEKS